MRDIDHLLGDDAGAGEFELRHRLARLAAKHRMSAGHSGTSLSPADVAVVLRLHRPRGDALEAAFGQPSRRIGGRPASRSIATAGSVYGPEVS